MNVIATPASDDRGQRAIIPPDPASQGYWPRGWPWSGFLELAALDSAEGSARGHAVNILHEWGLSGVADDAAQVVSELVSNAVAATHSDCLDNTVRCWVLGRPGAAVAAVWDGSVRPPVLREADPLAESGRGLAIIDYMTRGCWGHYFPLLSNGGGKIVWGFLELRRTLIGHGISAGPGDD